jgi:IclR family KDG regulon transcriptional repressor
LRIHSRIGAAVPLYCTAVGKVMLAYLPPEEQLRLLPQFEIKRLTPNTVGSLQELQTQMQKVRKRGHACDLEEHELHIRCIAAPIWDHAGAVNASLSITAPVVRMSLTRLRELAPLIQEAGLKISKHLGYQGPSEANVRPSAETARGEKSSAHKFEQKSTGQVASRTRDRWGSPVPAGQDRN